MTGGVENTRFHGVLMMRNTQSNTSDYERAELLQIGGSGGGSVPIRVHSSAAASQREKVDDPVCTRCQDKITQRYLLQVNGLHYHTECLRCYVCSVGLASETSCFIRDARVYCKADYYRTYGSAQCAKCGRWISSTDWVRRARDSHAEQIYHLACFACDACHRQLSTGEEFALVEKKLLCKTHYQETCDTGDELSDENDGECDESKSGNEGESRSSRSSKSKTKRVRTTFTDEQLQILQANFQIDSNPDGQDLERIAQITGLSKRVTQVWFQNSRARQKKHHHSGGSGGGGGKVMNNNSPALVCSASGSSSPTTLHHHHYVHASHHAVHHQQQISRVLTRDTLSSNSPQNQD